jgi:hypothetical protein
MSFDGGSLVRALTGERIQGLMASSPSVLEEFGTLREVTDLSGTVLSQATAETLPRDVATQHQGDSVLYIADKLTSTNYDLQWYARGFKISKGELRAVDAYAGDHINGMADIVYEHVMMGLDLDLQSVLSSTSLNQEQAAGTAWSSALSTPIKNGHDAKETYCPEASMGFVGSTNALELMRHADVKEALTSFPASGSISKSLLEQTLMNMWDLPGGVRVLRRYYNSAAAGQSATLATAFGDFAWMGVPRGLLYFKQAGSGEAETWEDPETKKVHTSFDIFADPVRVDQSLGVYISGT